MSKLSHYYGIMSKIVASNSSILNQVFQRFSCTVHNTKVWTNEPRCKTRWIVQRRSIMEACSCCRSLSCPRFFCHMPHSTVWQKHRGALRNHHECRNNAPRNDALFLEKKKEEKNRKWKAMVILRRIPNR